MRCMHEAQLHEFKCFITLTYDNEHLPRGGTLVKKHLQDFFKRLRERKEFAALKIKYYACGEYGDETQRPHYHALIFGADFPDKKLYSRNAQGDSIFTSDLLDSIWSHGQCKIGALTYETAAYCARYVLKKAGKKFAAGHYERIDLETGEVITLVPEYAVMSRRPGIGADFYDRYASDIYPDDFVLHKGRKHKPPRYYDKLLERSNPARLAKIKIHRESKQADSADNNTTARLRVREAVKLSQISTLKRNTL